MHNLPLPTIDSAVSKSEPLTRKRHVVHSNVYLSHVSGPDYEFEESATTLSTVERDGIFFLIPDFCTSYALYKVEIGLSLFPCTLQIISNLSNVYGRALKR